MLSFISVYLIVREYNIVFGKCGVKSLIGLIKLAIFPHQNQTILPHKIAKPKTYKKKGS